MKEDRIILAHGSGGQSSHALMAEVFAPYFHNETLDALEDAAVLDISGKIAYSTDSFVVTPLFFKGGNIGKLAVCGTVNDLLMMGAVPKYLTCGFILEEGLLIEDLKKIVQAMAEQAEEAGVTIVAGDTKVIEGHGGLYINTSGIGIIPEGREARADSCKPGDKILLSGTLGNHQACIYSARMEIENDIESDCGCLADITEALYEAGISVRCMRDVTRGGLGTILNEIARSSNCGMILREQDVPKDDRVTGLSDILGLDPYYMANEGKMIAIVPEDQAEKALEAMKKAPHGAKAAIVGEITEEGPVALKTKLGATRVLDVLYGEGLPRIC